MAAFQSTTRKGATLIFALVILGISTIVALSLATGGAIGTTSVSVVDDSATAFQLADSGVEHAFLKLIREKGSTKTVGDIGSCSSGKIEIAPSGYGSVGTPKYVLEFFDGSSPANKLGCGDLTIKVRIGQSTGYYGRAVRKIEFSVPEPDASLLGHWKLDETSGATARDASGNDNNASIPSGAYAWVTGKVGNGLAMTSGRLSVTDTSFDADKTASVAFWIKSSGAGSYTGVLHKLDAGSTKGWRIQRDGTTNKIHVRIDTDTNPANATLYNQTSDGLTVLDGTWHHVVMSLNDGQIDLYRDGGHEVKNNGYNTGGGFKNSEPLVLMGGDLNATFDDIRYYDRALSEQDAKNICYESDPTKAICK